MQTSGQENAISPRELEAVDTVTRPNQVTKPLSSSSATLPPDRAATQEIPDDDVSSRRIIFSQYQTTPETYRCLRNRCAPQVS